MAKKILIVEDEETYRVPLGQQLSAAGFEVIFADDGQQALEVVEESDLDLILLDLVMPRMDGVEFLYNLRHSLEITIPTIILTNLDQDVHQEGAADYLVKANVSVEDVVEKVKQYLG